MTNLLMIFLGGGLGSICRYGIAVWLKNYNQFPFGTLVANSLSSFILGVFIGISIINSSFLSDEVKMFFMVGFCGGFSTYSTFTNDTFQLMQAGNYLLFFLNVIGNLILCLLTLYGGIIIGKAIV